MTRTWTSLTAGMIVVLMAGVVFAPEAASKELPPLSGETVPLWPDGPPLSKGEGPGHAPTLTKYFPEKDKATGTAIVVCPGGGYGNLATGHEGEDIAQWLLGEGIAAFVLCYRHAPEYNHPVPLMDAQRAVRTVRANASGWGVNPERIGVLGFSAGGHLTATTGTQFVPGDGAAADPIERVSSRPDFLVPVYPVIDMIGEYTHRGSRRNLLGPKPSDEMMKKMSAHLQVTKETPPTFLVHTHEDKGVPSENSILFYMALHKNGVPSEMHIYEKGRHGLGLAPEDPSMSTWPQHCIQWLRGRGLLD